MPLQTCLLSYKGSNTGDFFSLEQQLPHVRDIIDSKDLRLLRCIRRYHHILVDMAYGSSDEVDVFAIPAESGGLGRIILGLRLN